MTPKEKEKMLKWVEENVGKCWEETNAFFKDKGGVNPTPYRLGFGDAYSLLSKEIGETKAINNSYADKIAIQNEQIEKLQADYVYWKLEANAKFKEITEKDARLEIFGNENRRLKELLYEVCVRANIIFPETESALDWFEEKFIHQHSLFEEIATTLHLGENDEFKDNQL